MGTCSRNAAPKHVEPHFRSNPVSPQQVEEILRRLNRVRIQRQNDVVHEKTTRGGRTVRRDVGDKQTGDDCLSAVASDVLTPRREGRLFFAMRRT